MITLVTVVARSCTSPPVSVGIRLLSRRLHGGALGRHVLLVKLRRVVSPPLFFSWWWGQRARLLGGGHSAPMLARRGTIHLVKLVIGPARKPSMIVRPRQPALLHPVGHSAHVDLVALG